jgi:oligopeptidase B
MNPLVVRRIVLLVPVIFLLLAADNAPAPPIAKKVPHETEINGHKMIDNYYWLREKSNPEVRAYLEKENAYTDAVMKPTEPLQKKLYDEMLSRVKETDVEVPYKEGDYFYYVRTEAGKQYQIRCRKKASMDAPEEVLLDINQMAQGKPFMTVHAFAVHAGGERPAHRPDSQRSCGARRLSRLGERQSDDLLYAGR